MDLEPGVTKQGVRDLNSLGPKKSKKRNAGDSPRVEGGGEPAQVPEPPVADTAPVAVLPPA
jgi:hypothetical protein